jgi:hypothetical protein
MTVQCLSCGFEGPASHFVERSPVTLQCRKCYGTLVQADASQFTGMEIIPDQPGAYQPSVYVANETDVREEKDSVKRFVDSTNAVVQDCPNIPRADRQGWQDFRDEFYRFYTEKEGGFLPWYMNPGGTAIATRDQYIRAQHYREELDKWQKRLAPFCSGDVGPNISQIQPPDPGILDRLKKAQDDANTFASKFQTTAIWLAVIGAVVLGGLAIANVHTGGKILEKMPVIP